MNNRKFQGMIFDNGDILFDASVWRRWLHGKLISLGVELTFDELVTYWEAELIDVYRGRAEYWDRFGRLLKKFKVGEDAQAELQAAARQKAIEVQQHRVTMPGVKETLAALRELDVRLAVLSDTEGGESAVRAILRQLEIEELFDAVVASSDIGHAKPAPAAYEYAVRALDLSHNDCAFIAHDVDELTGAQQVGLFAIAYNDTPLAPRDATIQHFSELLEYAPA